MNNFWEGRPPVRGTAGGRFGAIELTVGRAAVYKVEQVTDEVDEACLGIAAMGFGRDYGDPFFRQDVANHIRAGELYVAYEGGRPAAFRILQEKGRGVIYLAGAAKVPGAQKHLVREMTRGLLKKKRPKTVVTRTGNDFVLEEMLYLCREVMPFNRKVDESALRMAADAGLGNGRICRETLVIEGYYGGEPMLNPALGRPCSRDGRIAGFMRKVMPDEAYFAGGAVILVGRHLK